MEVVAVVLVISWIAFVGIVFRLSFRIGAERD